MRRKPRITKVVDVVVEVSCLAGRGKVREEIWYDETGQVARYNLAFINHFLFRRDNGRVLGYDMAHGYHHRHWIGTMEAMEFPGYEELSTRFYNEVSALRKRSEV